MPDPVTIHRFHVKSGSKSIKMELGLDPPWCNPRSGPVCIPSNGIYALGHTDDWLEICSVLSLRIRDQNCKNEREMKVFHLFL